MGRLEGKVAFITGAGSGIARAAARLFAREGASVAVAEIQADLGRRTAEEVGAEGGRAIFLETDVTDEESVREAIARTVEELGPLTTLYNCAGGSLPDDGPVGDVDLAVWEHTLSLDLKGTFLCCRHAIPRMIEAGGGAIVNMSSVVALQGNMPLHVYSSAKGGILSLTRSLAGSYARQGIRANVICPGVVLTERVKQRVTDPATGAGPGVDPDSHPFSVGEPEDIAAVALFLASDESRMITGATIPAEGGLSAY